MAQLASTIINGNLSVSGALASNGIILTSATAADNLTSAKLYAVPAAIVPVPTLTANNGAFNGIFYATKVYNAVWNDIAEFMIYAEISEAGDVIIMTNEGVKKSFKRAQKSVIGIHSDTFGYALGTENQELKTPIGLAGRVNVKVKEKLEIGDLLVSDFDGFASKADPYEETIPGVIIGKVLEEKNDTEVSRISMLIINR